MDNSEKTRSAVWSILDNKQTTFGLLFLGTTAISYLALIVFDWWSVLLDDVIRVGLGAVIIGFTVIIGGEIMEWASEKLKKKHREEGLAEGRKEGEETSNQNAMDWYIREKERGTLGTDKQSPPPFEK